MAWAQAATCTDAAAKESHESATRLADGGGHGQDSRSSCGDRLPPSLTPVYLPGDSLHLHGCTKQATTMSHKPGTLLRAITKRITTIEAAQVHVITGIVEHYINAHEHHYSNICTAHGLSLFLTTENIWYIQLLKKQEFANLVQIAAQFGSAMDEYVDKVVCS
ncbi:unnamed protein product [Miscanthus lutarioriparius]|uniref:Uncharacterized protein n=1 Tax=Miscanthus lutarioriparius TaxID=422564 RepID=A0A811N2A6_9POAL|nr:unnamed protein product [Miscanthus lutarioriparius]